MSVRGQMSEAKIRAAGGEALERLRMKERVAKRRQRLAKGMKTTIDRVEIERLAGPQYEKRVVRVVM